MNNRGRILSCDMFDHKLKLISAGAKRLGITTIATLLRDASTTNDTALPVGGQNPLRCSVQWSWSLSRKPEIRYKDDLIPTICRICSTGVSVQVQIIWQ